jgi:hypothetical protein
VLSHHVGVEWQRRKKKSNGESRTVHTFGRDRREQQKT